MGKNAAHLVTDKQCVRRASQPTQRRGGVQDVRHLHATVDGTEVMLVIPHPIETGALFVEEAVGCIHVLDLRPPGDRDARGRTRSL